MGNGKTNRHAFVFYPESLDFYEVFGLLRAAHAKAMISPVHDRDVWHPDDVLNRCRDCFRRDNSGFLRIVRCDHIWDDHDQRFISTDLFGNPDLYAEPDVQIITNKRDLKLRFFMAGYHCQKTDRVNYVPLLPDNNKFSELYSVPDSIVWTSADGDTDVLPLPGEVKKAHYHVATKFDYSLTPENALKKLGIDDLISYMEPIVSETGYIRYLCHLDDPDKAEYSPADVVTIGGYSTDPLYIQGVVDAELANEDLYDLACRIRTEGGGFSNMLASVMAMDWQARKAFRANQAMWRNFLFKPSEKTD